MRVKHITRVIRDINKLSKNNISEMMNCNKIKDTNIQKSLDSDTIHKSIGMACFLTGVFTCVFVIIK